MQSSSVRWQSLHTFCFRSSWTLVDKKTALPHQSRLISRGLPPGLISPECWHFGRVTDPSSRVFLVAFSLVTLACTRFYLFFHLLMIRHSGRGVVDYIIRYFWGGAFFFCLRSCVTWDTKKGPALPNGTERGSLYGNANELGETRNKWFSNVLAVWHATHSIS